MKNLTEETERQLAPPGAGLPRFELTVAKLIFAWTQRRSTRAGATARLATERHNVMALVGSCDSETLRRRVLIDRLRGLEDSSRFWSALMTLDHLRIVNLAIAESIRLLGLGQVPARAASTARVKPDPEVGTDVIAEFEESCDRVDEAAAAVPNLHTSVRYTHPWFGPLDAAAWHVMAGFHVGLHRRQIEIILNNAATGPV